jgi:peptidyl-prolyl cis-trans isomerase C
MFQKLAGTVVLIVAAVLVLPAAAQNAEKKPAAQKTVSVSMETVVANVNGYAITMGDMVAAKSDLPAPYNQSPMQELFEPLLQEMIERRLIAGAAEDAKLAEDPGVVRRLRETRARILQEEFLRRAVEPAMTEDKLKARHEAMSKEGGEDEVHARHILVATKQEADANVAELEKGADFAELAKTKSTGPSSSKGGDLGYFKKSAMVPEFADVAFSLKPGEVSEPVKTQFGWHVIKLDDRRKSPPPPLESKINEIRQAIVTEEVRKIVMKLSETADIKVFNFDGSPRETPAIGNLKK